MNTSWETFPGLNSILEDPKNTVATACKAIESCIDANRCVLLASCQEHLVRRQLLLLLRCSVAWLCRDNLRGFFEGCFSLLLKCIFGYEGSSWLNTIAKVRFCSAGLAGTGCCLFAHLCQFRTHSCTCSCWMHLQCLNTSDQNSNFEAVDLLLQGGTEADAKALVSLLSPGSKLLQAIHGADADSLIKFIFPPERLPSHTQLLLVADNGRWATMLVFVKGTSC